MGADPRSDSVTASTEGVAKSKDVLDSKRAKSVWRCLPAFEVSVPQ
jgi:hypothetical protein